MLACLRCGCSELTQPLISWLIPPMRPLTRCVAESGRTPRPWQLGAGIGLPSFDLARRVASVTLTDARPALLELSRENIEKVRLVHQGANVPLASMNVMPLQWGEIKHVDEQSPSVAPPPKLLGFDLAIGADICYDEAGVEALAAMIEALRASVTIIIGPVTRPSLRLLAQSLERNHLLRVETLKLTLVCRDASEDAKDGDTATGVEPAARVRSGGVHLVLIIKRAA